MYESEMGKTIYLFFLCIYLTALSQEAMTGLAKFGTQAQGRKCTHWMVTAMLSTPFLSTILMGKSDTQTMLGEKQGFGVINVRYVYFHFLLVEPSKHESASSCIFFIHSKILVYFSIAKKIVKAHDTSSVNPFFFL